VALTKYNFNSFDVTSAASKALGFNANANGFTTISPGSMTHIKTLTASSSSTISFAHGSSDVVLDSTYPVYLFKFSNVHPATNSVHFQVNFRDGSTAYDATKTTTNFRAEHNEADSETALGYAASRDLAQSTAAQTFAGATLGNGNDESLSGELHLFDPSSTTFVKHFIARASMYHESNAIQDCYVAGYCNVTAAIDGVQFSMSSGNIDAGTFKLYGIKDS
jgi:hypothetical protein